MPLMLKRLSFPFMFLVVGLAAASFPASQASAAPSKCRPPLSVKLNSHDPTQLLEGAQAWVYVSPRAGVRGARVTVKRGGKLFANGRITGRLASGRTTVVKLHRKRTISRGKYRVSVSAKIAGCSKRRSKTRVWGFGTPSLPVKALPYSTRVNDNVDVVRFALRPIRRTDIGAVRVTLVNSNGATVAEDLIPGLGSDQVVVELPISSRLKPGKYTVRLAGQDRSSNTWRRSDQEIRFVSGGGSAKPVSPTGMEVQKVAVDWSAGKWQGRQMAGFIAPGIGFGEIVCSPQQQWIRFFPSNGGREAAMMAWTDKDWGKYREVALREAKYANGTGPDFREGFNKFGPTEKWSRGSFQGIISDRGPIEGPGGVSLAPPTTYDLKWEWDFSKPKKSSCHVEAIFRTGTGRSDKPIARSAQVVWRGETNATPKSTVGSVDFPGLGDVTVEAEAGPTGVRSLSIDSAVGGRVETREGSDAESVVFEKGPITARLPNNGMIFVQLNSGERIVVSSRWKVNDPAPENNWAVVAAQIYSP